MLSSQAQVWLTGDCYMVGFFTQHLCVESQFSTDRKDRAEVEANIQGQNEKNVLLIYKNVDFQLLLHYENSCFVFTIFYEKSSLVVLTVNKELFQPVHEIVL